MSAVDTLNFRCYQMLSIDPKLSTRKVMLNWTAQRRTNICLQRTEAYEDACWLIIMMMMMMTILMMIIPVLSYQIQYPDSMVEDRVFMVFIASVPAPSHIKHFDHAVGTRKVED